LKLKITILYLFLLIIPFCDCFSGLTINQNMQVKHTNLIQDQFPQRHFLLGSINYMTEIEEICNTKGNRAAIDKIMEDVDNYNFDLDSNSSQNILRLYGLISNLINKQGYVDMKIHYFRNKLNRAPKSLRELINLNSSLPAWKQWHLIPVKSSLYHLQGDGGEYNLKFVSAEGFCEAVYNKKGILLTENNDPVNMGTFNYAAGIKQQDSHTKYDVNPYLLWGNSMTSPQKGSIEIKEGSSKALERFLENEASISEYRKKIYESYSSSHK